MYACQLRCALLYRAVRLGARWSGIICIYCAVCEMASWGRGGGVGELQLGSHAGGG